MSYPPATQDRPRPKLGDHACPECSAPTSYPGRCILCRGEAATGHSVHDDPGPHGDYGEGDE